jgi:hypothetical protein
VQLPNQFYGDWKVNIASPPSNFDGNFAFDGDNKKFQEVLVSHDKSLTVNAFVDCGSNTVREHFYRAHLPFIVSLHLYIPLTGALLLRFFTTSALWSCSNVQKLKLPMLQVLNLSVKRHLQPN